ncbi:uncharacterized protein LOC134282208, partial [Saccostrea cucullata]|uniref:uncharacterized protein LOC134282208 n=1 Tax=Saccostrea cuccullata TaxID=36930 RepID=UPI002ED3993A
MDNTINETIAVHIDTSVPDIVEMYLIKDGVRHLFVHNSTDLSRMKISFRALDEHSGLNSIEWMLGTSPDGGELGRGSIAVNRLEPGVTCNHTENCYCPKVGVCEKALYSVKFNSLIKNNKQNGHHNREYFFTVKVTNNAMLVSISRTDILADDSPPVSGNAMEGEIGSQEIDYTCNREIIVRWSGFIDHESGIKKYRIGFNDKCLSREDLLHNNHATLLSYIYETNEQQIKVRADHPGLYFTSVIAYNYAMEASEVACSNGITYDISPPKLYNIILEHAKTTEGIACYNRTPWLILQNFTAVKLEMTQACQKICNESSKEFPLLENMFYVKQEHFNDTSYADSICKNLGIYFKNIKVYIPSDTISLSWNVTDLETQIHDILIGFASTKSQSETPDILSFTPAKRLQSDKRLHSALDSGTPFYITIKATSKAGLETSATIGPVVIDDTPPLYRGGVNIVLGDKFAFVAWTNETFVDEEQDEPISMVLFKIGQGSTFKTPLLQGYLSNSCPNPTDNR